jgi:hypothetical protein
VTASKAPAIVTPEPTSSALVLADARADFDLTFSVRVGQNEVSTVEVAGAADADGNRWFTVYAPGDAVPVGSAAWLRGVHVVKSSTWQRGPLLQGEPEVDLKPYFLASSSNSSLSSDGLHCTPAEGVVERSLFEPLLGKTKVPAGTHFIYQVVAVAGSGCRLSLVAKFTASDGSSMTWTRELVMHPDPEAVPPVGAIEASGLEFSTKP